MNNSTSYKTTENSLQLKLRELLRTLPYQCELFFRGIETTTSIKTRIAYAYDLKIFFYFLTNEIDIFHSLSPKDFTTDDLEKITALHIEKYLEYLLFTHCPL